MDLLQTWLFTPLSLDFMQRALLIALMIGTVCSVFSCFLILKGWSLMGDAVSHAVLPGLALAYVLGVPLLLGAFVAGLFCAGAIGYIKENSRVKEDTVMGVVFSGMFAAGLVMLTKIETDVHLLHVLFGDVLGISTRDLIETGIAAGIATTIMLLKRRDLMLYCFDPAHAGVIGLNTRLLHFGLLTLLSLTIVASLKAAGVILVVAMLIAPGAIAFLLTKSFDKMLLIAMTVSVLSCVTGTLLSFHLDTATAPLIVVIQFFIFILTLGYTLARPQIGKAAA
ncbi:MAG TPA: metal ABC transporter permease [Alphaproteobacteria bacterium]|nr:metal ABC transporter permease [Alphaproteobacteria bacterium]